MRARVQSKHLLNEQLLVKIWQRSEATESDRHFPLGKRFEDWQCKPQTNLGVITSNLLYFWMNWYRGVHQNQERLVSSMILEEEPEEWRIVINLDEAEKENSVVITEDGSSVYVYWLDSSELTRFRLVRKDGPRLLESKVEEVPAWVMKKIEELHPEAVLARVQNLRARVQQLKQRRSDSSNQSA